MSELCVAAYWSPKCTDQEHNAPGPDLTGGRPGAK